MAEDGSLKQKSVTLPTYGAFCRTVVSHRRHLDLRTDSYGLHGLDERSDVDRTRMPLTVRTYFLVHLDHTCDKTRGIYTPIIWHDDVASTGTSIDI